MDIEEKKKIAEKYGWKLKSGYYFDAEDINLVDFNKFYIEEKQLMSYVHKCEYWSHTDEEVAFEKHEIDDLLERLNESDILEVEEIE